MSATPKRGATESPDKGVFRSPATSGVRDTRESNPYRAPPSGASVDISRIGYEPNGGVYERKYVGDVEPSMSGGMYERPLEVVVVPASTILSSSPYPTLNTENMAVDSLLTLGQLNTVPRDDATCDSLLLSGTLNAALISYLNWPDEDMSVDSPLTSGTLYVALISYLNWPDEDMSVDSLITSGTLVVALISYQNWPDEDMSVDSILTGGTLV